MKPGDKVYRVVRLLDWNNWYFCVYEFVKAVCHIESSVVELAPILTFYSNSDYKKHSTFHISRHVTDDLDDWVRKWDYITTDEQKALAVYKEKTNNETKHK